MRFAGWSRFTLGLGVLLLFLALGEAVVRLLRLPVPGSVLGMVLLAEALRRGWVPLALVRPAAELLIRQMGFLFVPPGVALILYLDLLRAQWAVIVTASVVSTFAVLLAVGALQQRLEDRG